MRLNQLPALIDDEVTFPASSAEIVRRIGHRQLDAPDPAASESIASVLDRCEEAAFDSPQLFLATVHGALGEAYVGRKYYDDRGMDLPTHGDGPRADARHRSF